MGRAVGEDADPATTSLKEQNARLRAELEAARVEREALHQFLDTPAVAMTQMRRDGTIVLINGRGARNLGSTPDELEGKSMLELLPALAEQTRARLAQTLDSGKPLPVESHVRLPTGDRWFRSTYYPVFDAAGAATTVQLVSQDVTALKRAEQMHAATEGRLAVILQYAPQLIVILDPDGVIRYVNRVPAGYDESTLVGARATANLPAEFAEPFHDALRGVLDDADPRLLEVDDLFGRTWEIRLAPILQDGEVHQILAFVVDVSSRKAADERERQLEAQLQHAQKLESLGVLAGGIAHDFNNILVGVLGNAQLALNDVGTVGSRACLQDIVQAAQRAAELCRQMLAYAGRGELAARAVSVSAISTEMLDLVRSSISKRARVEVDCPTELPVVMGDATQLGQVVMNLLTNASEALGDGEGTITLRSGVMECDAAYLRRSIVDAHLAPGPHVFVEVSDTGSGMDAETRRRMFDPFFTSKQLGSGLGLAAVLGIVRRHRGAIVVESRPGHGTTICVALPIMATASEAPSAEPAVSSTTPGTILVVDDDAMVRAVAQRVLEGAGHRVLLATQGAEALEKYDALGGAVDAVLLDLSMPVMDGRQTLAELRKRDVRLPVILATGYRVDAEDANGSDTATQHLSKPYGVSVLLAAIHRALSGR